MKALKVNGMSRDNLPYKAPFQPWGAWFAFISTAIITFFKGFDSFLPWNTATFITWVALGKYLQNKVLTEISQQLRRHSSLLSHVAGLQALL